MRSRQFVLACLASLGLMLGATSVAAAAPAVSGQRLSCPFNDVGSPTTMSPGYRGTSVTSYQVAGPGTIHYTVTKAAAQAWGASASVGFDVGLFIAKAHTTFGVNYTHTATSTQSWGYDTTIPSGHTGLMAVLHRNDRLTYTETIHYENCTTATRHGYGYVPLSTTANTSYCIIRDLAPYGYTNWRSTCAGE